MANQKKTAVKKKPQKTTAKKAYRAPSVTKLQKLAQVTGVILMSGATT